MGKSTQNLTGYPSIDRPWLKYYSEEAISAPLPETTIYEYIFRCNQDNYDRVAMNYYGTEIRYREMFEEISRLAGILAREGIKEGDIVTIAMINSPETVFLFFALNKLGAVVNMVYGQSTPEELKTYLLTTKSTVAFTLDMFQDTFAQIADEAGLERIVVASLMPSALSAKTKGAAEQPRLPADSRFIRWEAFFSGVPGQTESCGNADSPAMITYTGGTTGGSKGAIFSNRALLSVAWQFTECNPELRRESTWLQILPLFIAYGVTCSLLIPFIVGMTLLIRLPNEPIAEIYKKFKVNHIVYAPSFWEEFADADINFDLSNLITPITGGDVLREKTEEKINAYLKKQKCAYPILNGYGMTETGAAVAVNRRYAHELGSVGIPFVKNIISAFDEETGQELKYGQRGEICIHTPSMMMGYIGNQEENQRVIKKHDDGLLWVHSGDLGYVTEDGFVHIDGRSKRYMLHLAQGVIKKIFSLDIEKVLMLHPEVDSCAVVPMAGPAESQVPAAVIVLKGGRQAGQETEREFAVYAEKNLADGYRPARYFFLDKLPLTKIGKVDYLKLEEMANRAQEEKGTAHA